VIAEAAARSLKVEPITVPVHSDVEIETAIIALGREPGGGLVVMPDVFMTEHRASIILAAARNNLPTVYSFSGFARDGGLLSYGVDQVTTFRRAASYVDRILRGEKPSELGVQFSTKFELVINLKTAKALGLTVPPNRVAVADEVIESTAAIHCRARGGDPTSNGLVSNIARPEGNVTGFANNFGSLGGRWLELFKQAVPRLSRIADIFFANELSVRNELRATIPAAAAQLGVTIIRMPVRNVVEIEHAISVFAAEPDGGLLLTGANPAIGEAIGRLALYHRLPLMSGGGTIAIATEGVLMAHGPQILDLARRASSYVDRILRGAKPGELPVQYPTKFQLVVNLKTAKAIGVTIPETFLARADEVIE
jgi:ABC-type uncharacterized transport system substrate-binding protein